MSYWEMSHPAGCPVISLAVILGQSFWGAHYKVLLQDCHAFNFLEGVVEGRVIIFIPYLNQTSVWWKRQSAWKWDSSGPRQEGRGHKTQMEKGPGWTLAGQTPPSGQRGGAEAAAPPPGSLPAPECAMLVLLRACIVCVGVDLHFVKKNGIRGLVSTSLQFYYLQGPFAFLWCFT